jgi:hypothetical protein
VLDACRCCGFPACRAFRLLSESHIRLQPQNYSRPQHRHVTEHSQLPYGTSQRRPSPFCMAAYTRDSYSTVLHGYPQSHPSARTVPQTGPPRPSIRSPPHSTPQCGLLYSFAKSGEHVTEGCQVPRCSHRQKACRCRRFDRTCCLRHQDSSLYRPTHRSMHRHNTTPHWPLNCDEPR